MSYLLVDDNKEFVNQNGYMLPTDVYFDLGKGDCDKIRDATTAVHSIFRIMNPRLKNVYVAAQIGANPQDTKNHSFNSVLVLGRRDLYFSNIDVTNYTKKDGLVGITVNRNAVPFDPRPPMISSGVRIGTPALAASGFGSAEFAEVADVVADALRPTTDESALDALRDRVAALATARPLYPTLKETPR